MILSLPDEIEQHLTPQDAALHLAMAYSSTKASP